MNMKWHLSLGALCAFLALILSGQTAAATPLQSCVQAAHTVDGHNFPTEGSARHLKIRSQVVILGRVFVVKGGDTLSDLCYATLRVEESRKVMNEDIAKKQFHSHIPSKTHIKSSYYGFPWNVYAFLVSVCATLMLVLLAVIAFFYRLEQKRRLRAEASELGLRSEKDTLEQELRTEKQILEQHLRMRIQTASVRVSRLITFCKKLLSEREKFRKTATCALQALEIAQSNQGKIPSFPTIGKKYSLVFAPEVRGDTRDVKLGIPIRASRYELSEVNQRPSLLVYGLAKWHQSPDEAIVIGTIDLQTGEFVLIKRHFLEHIHNVQKARDWCAKKGLQWTMKSSEIAPRAFIAGFGVELRAA